MNPPQGSPLRAAGIDVGSSSVKLALVRDCGHAAEVLHVESERLRRRDPRELCEGLYAKALAQVGLRADEVDYVATTGEGEHIPFRTGHFYGMTTHARGAILLESQTRAVLDVGALHARAVLIDERAKVLGARMTSQCASGSGQFLENICRYLGITLADIGPLSLQADAPESCSSICAVLAETDVINMVSRGISAPNIIKGIHQSMAGRFLKLLTSLGARGTVLVTGGLAADVGLLAALREAAAEAGSPLDLRAHPHSIYSGALGAALWGAFRARKLARKGLRLEGVSESERQAVS
jgi:benzoyl-CoA reductase subunit D